ncbi:MAG TPA: ATP-binding protein, partial [Clostridia bacterium]|nr:ATP-binding protein [Clostridia bacterium]
EAMSNAVAALHRKRDSFESFSGRLHLLMDAMETEGPQNRRVDMGGASDHVQGREINEVYNRYRGKVGHISSVKGIAWRLYSLERTGIFIPGSLPVESAIMDRKMAVIQGPLRLLQVYGAYLFDRLYLKRRAYRDSVQVGEEGSFFPPFFLITDEAHNFCMRGEGSSLSKRVTRTIAQEGRKYGVQLVLATQRPALLDDTVTSQLNTKIIFRTVRSMDIATIKEETDIGSAEAARLPYLVSGNAFISSAITGRAISVRIRCAKTISPHIQNPFDELEAWSLEQENRFFGVVRDMLPIGILNLNTYLPLINDKMGQALSGNEILSKLETLVNEGLIRKEEGPLGEQYISKE